MRFEGKNSHALPVVDLAVSRRVAAVQLVRFETNGHLQ
jgi:hypothetical protein